MQLGLHQTKKLYTAKETINKGKMQLTEWEKMCAHHIFGKGLISKIYLKTCIYNSIANKV